MKGISMKKPKSSKLRHIRVVIPEEEAKRKPDNVTWEQVIYTGLDTWEGKK